MFKISVDILLSYIVSDSGTMLVLFLHFCTLTSFTWFPCAIKHFAILVGFQTSKPIRASNDTRNVLPKF